MDFKEYQEFAKKDWKPGCDDITFALGLGGETGEVLDILKKARRDRTVPDMAHLAEEIGDVLWYVANLCTAFGFSLEEVAEKNKQKLIRRYSPFPQYRRNGPHIEQLDPATGKHIRFVCRAQFTAEELKQIDDAYYKALIAQGAEDWMARKATVCTEESDHGQEECPFD